MRGTLTVPVPRTTPGSAELVRLVDPPGPYPPVEPTPADPKPPPIEPDPGVPPRPPPAPEPEPA
ncbi:MAG TPA: hypothetical protein VG779_05970 [Actinomycetota bacterium]|nr:hypothetical protein [Actinomycetota bacterium]